MNVGNGIRYSFWVSQPKIIIKNETEILHFMCKRSIENEIEKEILFFFFVVAKFY